MELDSLWFPFNLSLGRVRLCEVDIAKIAIGGVEGVNLIYPSAVGFLDGGSLETRQS